MEERGKGQLHRVHGSEFEGRNGGKKTRIDTRGKQELFFNNFVSICKISIIVAESSNILKLNLLGLS